MFANAVYYWRNYILSAPISFLTLSTFFKNRENAYVFVVLYIVFNRGFITGGFMYIKDLCRIILLTRSMESKYGCLFSPVY